MGNTAKHTPAPWKIDQITGLVGGCTLVASVFPCKTKEVDGDLVWESDAVEENHRANANLIAAAPDMLRALELVLNSDMAQREEDEGNISTPLSHVRAAILKAEGK